MRNNTAEFDILSSKENISHLNEAIKDLKFEIMSQRYATIFNKGMPYQLLKVLKRKRDFYKNGTESNYLKFYNEMNILFKKLFNINEVVKGAPLFFHYFNRDTDKEFGADNFEIIKDYMNCFNKDELKIQFNEFVLGVTALDNKTSLYENIDSFFDNEKPSKFCYFIDYLKVTVSLNIFTGVLFYAGSTILQNAFEESNLYGNLILEGLNYLTYSLYIGVMVLPAIMLYNNWEKNIKQYWINTKRVEDESYFDSSKPNYISLFLTSFLNASSSSLMTIYALSSLGANTLSVICQKSDFETLVNNLNMGALISYPIMFFENIIYSYNIAEKAYSPEIYKWEAIGLST